MLSEDKVRALRFEILKDADAAMQEAARSDERPPEILEHIARMAGSLAALSAVLEDDDIPEWDFLEAVRGL